MRYYIATDHSGVEVKNFTKELLKKRGFEVIDFGPNSSERVDYPDFAKKVAKAVSEDSESFGILICGSGIGMSLTANKFEKIRAALCNDIYSAKMARAHNDANILCFGARVVGYGVIEKIVETWCESEFEGGRHSQRVAKIDSKI